MIYKNKIILAVFLFFIGFYGFAQNNKTVPATSVNNYSKKREVLNWYTSLGAIRAKSSDGNTVLIEIVFGYKLGDENAEVEFAQRTIEIKDYLRNLMMKKTKNEILNPKNEEKLSNEIKNGINQEILNQATIRDVRFLQKEITE
ncbi:MAG: flagellar basal body-associated FliL family protein [Treponema sp.]|nr:flagellar basal body-associated FliL family protein [Treponema sp.]